jgi:hypothetical protein
VLPDNVRKETLHRKRVRQASFLFSYCSSVQKRKLACRTFITDDYVGYEGMLSTWFIMVSCLIYSFTLKMEAACFSKTSSDIQRTTQHHIQKDRSFYKKLHDTDKKLVRNVVTAVIHNLTAH